MFIVMYCQSQQELVALIQWESNNVAESAYYKIRISWISRIQGIPRVYQIQEIFENVKYFKSFRV